MDTANWLALHMGAHAAQNVVLAVMRQLRRAQHIANQVIHAPGLLAFVAFREGKNGLHMKRRRLPIHQGGELFAFAQIVIHEVHLLVLLYLPTLAALALQQGLDLG